MDSRAASVSGWRDDGGGGEGSRAAGRGHDRAAAAPGSANTDVAVKDDQDRTWRTSHQKWRALWSRTMEMLRTSDGAGLGPVRYARRVVPGVGSGGGVANEGKRKDSAWGCCMAATAIPEGA